MNDFLKSVPGRRPGTQKLRRAALDRLSSTVGFKIWGFNVGDYSYCGLLDCDMFCSEDGSSMSVRNVYTNENVRCHNSEDTMRRVKH
jgi:hypothetical protein